MSLRRSLVLSALVATCVAAGCNSLTGANDLTIENKDSTGAGATSAGQGGSTPATGPGSTTTTSGTGGSTATSTNASTGSGTTGTDAVGVNITEVALYQGVKREVMKNGAASNSSIPI